MKTYKAAVSVRGDCLYCPLSLSIDSYWNCLVDCHHCYMRRLNRTWGKDLRPSCPHEVIRKLRNGLKNSNPKTSLANALAKKKTLRLGNKTDPYQPAELRHRVSREIIKGLIKLEWTFVIQTRFLNNVEKDADILEKAHNKGLLTIMPVITCGFNKDVRKLERGRTPSVNYRFRLIERWLKRGWNVGVNGEPFIPGYHTTKQFRRMLQKLKSIGVQSYNTYNLHLNDHVAERLASIGLDIRKIWYNNQDRQWAPLQKKLCKIALEEDMILGCPDFVNTGPDWIERANTCCGISVPNPSIGTTHMWKAALQAGVWTPQRTITEYWEGIGDLSLAKKIVLGKPCKHFTMRDAGVL